MIISIESIHDQILKKPHQFLVKFGTNQNGVPEAWNFTGIKSGMITGILVDVHKFWMCKLRRRFDFVGIKGRKSKLQSKSNQNKRGKNRREWRPNQEEEIMEETVPTWSVNQLSGYTENITLRTHTCYKLVIHALIQKFLINTHLSCFATAGKYKRHLLHE